MKDGQLDYSQMVKNGQLRGCSLREEQIIYDRLVNYFNRLAHYFGNYGDNLAINDLDRLCELLMEGKKL